MSKKIGTIKEIWHYPIKSMAGSIVSYAQFTKNGHLGDRLWTIWDEINNQIVGGKQFRKIMRLKAVVKNGVGLNSNPLVDVVFPDGKRIASDKPYLNNLLSTFIGHPVSLKFRGEHKDFYLIRRKDNGLITVQQELGMFPDDAMKNLAVFPLKISLLLKKYVTPPGNLYDAYPLHFITTNTLTWLSNAHPKAQIDVRRFRPNFLIEGVESLPKHIDYAWQEGYLEIGSTVIKIGIPTIRCSMPAQMQPGLKEDLEVAKAIQTTANQFVGNYGKVLKGGLIREGDAVQYRASKKIWQLSAKLDRKIREPLVTGLAKLEHITNKIKKPNSKIPNQFIPENSDFQKFTVVSIENESELISSFYLKGKNYYSYLPGQHIIIAIPFFEQPKKFLIRSYSLSDFKPQKKTYRISVKREGENAIVSNYFHNGINIGDTVYVKRPRGQFFLHPQEKRPVILLGIGVGITPFMAMLDSVTTNNYQKGNVTLIYGCKNRRYHPFKKEIEEYSKNSKITTYVCYSQPEETDSNYQRKGRINIATIKQIVDSTDCLFYLCGRDEFMRQIYRDLREWGIKPSDIYYEHFGKSIPLEFDLKKTNQSIFGIYFQQSDLKVNWTSSCGNILDLAENCGLMPKFGCRYGVCHACTAGLKSGTVVYDDDITPPKDSQTLLLCCARPTDNLVINL